MTFALVNGQILTSQGFEWGDVLMHDGDIVAIGRDVGAGARERLDVHGALMSPGLVDVQVNGGWGIDLLRHPERVWELAERLVHDGVTSFCPTLVSSTPEARSEFLDVLRAGPPDDGVARARNRGAHLEGPVLNPRRRGAHPADVLVAPSIALAQDWTRDLVALVTLAPELPAATELIAELVARGITVSAGHTDATSDQLAVAADGGVTMVTHLYNAMAPFGHRSPGPIGAVLTHPSLIAGLIADGVHVHPTAVALAWKALGPNRLCLVSDAVAPMGVVDRGAEIRLADGTLAGSNLHLLDGVRNLISFTGCSIADALRAATSTPAGAIGDALVGTLAAGSFADVIVLDPDTLAMSTTVFAGRPLTHRARSATKAVAFVEGS
jgi:N-acetylglucosamine-6-phosphate deacetylase